MTDNRKSIFNWNHVSKDLDNDVITEMRSYYKTYHRKSWAYKQAWKKFKKRKLAANTASIVFAAGGIASAIATSGVSLAAISTVAIAIQGWMAHQTLDLKIQNCQYAYQSYDHLLIRIKEVLRTGNFDKDSLIEYMNNIDTYVIDLCPPIDKYMKKYDEKFISSS